MASYKLYLDKRKVEDGKPCPVSIIISHKNRTAHVPTGIRVLPDDIDLTDTRNNGKIIRGDNRARQSAVIAAKKMQVQRCLLDLTNSGRIDTMSVADIKRYIQNDGVDPNEGRTLFVDYFNRVAAEQTPTTRKTYHYAMQKLHEYNANIDNMFIDELDREFFERFMVNIQNDLATNTIFTIMAKIKHVYNAAIADDITQIYPFRKLKMKKAPTRKRSLSVDVLRELINMKLDGNKAYARDYFVLSFCLVGINPVDMYNLPKGGLNDGRIEYIRAKTNKQYSIKVEPEADAIIERHKGKKTLLDLADNFCHSVSAGSCLSVRLGNIMTDLSMYWARHTWATIAYNLGISKETISLALGHEIGSQVTSIYINPDQSKIDKANRQVLDFVFQK